MANKVEILGLSGIPEVREGDDIAQLVLDAAIASDVSLESGDVVVVKQKIVSKAEGRVILLDEISPSPLALEIGERYEKDPRHVEAVLRESSRIVKMDQGLIIAETRNGLICANAGVDASNVGLDQAVVLLPEDPDASADAIRTALEGQTDSNLGVIVSDSIGRPWRKGIIDLAIGISGLVPLRDYVGEKDDDGRELKVTVVAEADELASAAELVTGKLERCPVAVIKGSSVPLGNGRSTDLVMDPAKDLFR